MTIKEKLKELRKKAEQCNKCALCKDRNKVVFGEGNSNLGIMFIGEAPGYWEDKKGVPFVGKAGKILDEILEKINLKREEIYITNILKCRPPNNRNPTNEEIKTCTPYLNKQIEIINPKIICCLGNFATQYILEKYNLSKEIKGTSKVHGKIFEVNNLFGKIKIMPLYHPAVATYNPNMKETLLKDFKLLKELINKEGEE